MNDEFYIGYLPKAPAGTARLVKRTVAALAIGVLALAAILVGAQNRFAASAFEFGNERTFEGTVQVHPYPTLLVSRPGDHDQNASFSRYLLVAVGKHGAGQLVAPFDGKRVKLEGQLIYRDANTMIEIAPGSISTLDDAQHLAATTATEDLGEATLTGEILDTKCYFGVMNPGSGKVHRECAVRCISGGVPAAFRVRESEKIYLLTDSAGQPLDRGVMKLAAAPVTIQGRVTRIGDTLFFATSNGAFHSKSRGR